MNNIMSKKILMVFAGLSLVLGLAASNTLIIMEAVTYEGL